MSEPATTDTDEADTKSAAEESPEAPITVNSVSVRRAPGFGTSGFTVDGFSPGVNVIYGANAAGKTTLSEAIRWSLWPDEAPAVAEIDTQFTYNGDERKVELRGGVAENVQDGAKVDPISVPSLQGGRRYSLSLHDMLQEQTDDGEFASVIQRESTGGFDIDAIREDLNLGDGASPATRNLGATQEAKDAVNQVKDLRRETTDLEEEQQQLSKVKNRLADAEAAQERTDLLNKAIDYAAAKADYEEREEELDEFPEELSEFDGGELERLDELDEQIETQQRHEREAAVKHRDAAEKLAETELSDEISSEKFESLDKYQDRFSDAEDKRDRLQRELANAKEERSEVKQKLPLELEEETLRSVETGDLTELRSFVATLTEVDGKKEIEAAIKQWLRAESDSASDRSTLTDGQSALENWLAAPSERSDTEETGNQGTVWAGVSAGILTAASGIVIALTSSLLVALLGIGLTLLGVGLAGYIGVRAMGTDASTDNPRATHAETFRQTGLEEPVTWEEDAVRERLAEIRERLEEIELETQEVQRRKELLERYDTDGQEAELEAAREELQERFGTEVPDDLDLAVTVERVERWQAADEEVSGKQAELSTAKGQIEECRENFLAAIKPYRTETFDYEVETAADAAGVIESLKKRQRNFEQANETLEEVNGAVAEARSELDRLTSQRNALFTDRGLDPGDRGRLKELHEQLSDYEEAAEAVNTAETTLTNRLEDLQSHALFSEDIKHRDEAALREELEEKTELAQKYESLVEEKTELKSAIEDAKASTEVAEAVSQRDQALTELRSELQKDVEQAVTDSLLEFVENETVTGNQEPVFRRADELLRRVTDGQFELRLEDGKFRAYDTGEGRRVGLNDLSTGTRVQVLLAVRVAFVEHREQETAPPLLLDETLAPFDDQRAETVLDAVIGLARQGRQVFYFTARVDERERWRRRLEESEVEYSFHELTPANSHDSIAEPPVLDTPDVVDVPAPEGDNHEAYRQKLSVPTFNPRQGASSAPLWYVTDDPDTLYRLRAAGIERWGHLRSLLEIGAVDGLLSGDALERVRRHGAALEAFVDGYTVGRGKLVDRKALEDSGAVSDKFIEEASELAERVDGKPQAILNGLSNEVNYFREDKVDELRTYLRAEGYIDPNPTQPDDKIRSQVVNTYCQYGLTPEDASEATSKLLDRLSTESDSNDTET